MIGDREFNDFLARGLPPLVGRQQLVVVDETLDMFLTRNRIPL